MSFAIILLQNHLLQIVEVSVKVNQDDLLESHDQYVLMYNRVPKTGSSSMLRMLGAIRVSARLHVFGIKFLKFMEELFPQKRNNFQPTGIYKQNIQSLQRHLNKSEQMTYVKKLTDKKMQYFPKPIYCNNHVHYIGMVLEFTVFHY